SPAGPPARARCTSTLSASVQAVVVSRYSPAASGANAATATARYGSTRARAAGTDAAAPPEGEPAGARARGLRRPLARALGPVAGAPGLVAGALMRRATLADSQPMPASSRNRPANTAPCALSGPAPPSQWLPSGAPNRPWVSSVLGAPAMRGDRNSRYT